MRQVEANTTYWYYAYGVVMKGWQLAQAFPDRFHL